MFLLNKVFNLRDKASSNANEKPFLEHLEDLRNTVTKIVITLMVATISCYVFHSELMEVLRRPIEEVWRLKQESKLPKSIDADIWERAKKISAETQGISTAHRTILLQTLQDPTLAHHVEAAGHYRIAKLLNDPNATEEVNKAQEADYIRSLHLETELQDTILALIEDQPNANPNAKDKVVYMRSLKPTETFMLALKLSFFAAIIISFPLLLYFILQFILPGLKETEKKALWPAMAVGFGLFLTGVCFAYFFVLPRTLDFFYEFSKGMDVENEWRIGDYITFATQFTLIFGLAFELPVVVITLVKLGILSYPTMNNSRAYAVLTIVIVAAVITPTGDALTLSLLALPMCLLYEGCIWFAYIDYRKELKEEAKEAERWQSSKQPRLSKPEATVHSTPSHDSYDEHENAVDPYHDEHGNYIDPYHDEHGNYIDPYHDEHGNAIDPYHDEHGNAIDPYHDEHGNAIDPYHDEHGNAIDPHHDEHGNAIDPHHGEHDSSITESDSHQETKDSHKDEFQPYHDDQELEIDHSPIASQYPNGEHDPDYVDPTRLNHPAPDRWSEPTDSDKDYSSEEGEDDTQSCHEITEAADAEIEKSNTPLDDSNQVEEPPLPPEQTSTQDTTSSSKKNPPKPPKPT